MASVVIAGPVVERSPALVVARLINPNNGSYITQAGLSSIAYEVHDMSDEDTRIVESTAITISSTVFDTLQTDTFWTDKVDSTGYNFRWMIPGTTAFPTDHAYAVTIYFTPSSGTAWYQPCVFAAEKNHFGDS